MECCKWYAWSALQGPFGIFDTVASYKIIFMTLDFGIELIINLFY